MLTGERIKEAESNVKRYLDEGLLKKINVVDYAASNILQKNSEESLELVRIAFSKKISDLWVVVCSYYSMFYAANRLLNQYQYKVGDKIAHKVTVDALIGLMKSKIEKTYLDNYQKVEEEAGELAKINTSNFLESIEYERKKGLSINIQHQI